MQRSVSGHTTRSRRVPSLAQCRAGSRLGETSDDATKLLIANPAAAGTGFTLTAASYAIYESLTWRFDLYAQSQDRNHRIGQSLPVTYLRLLGEDTIDAAILDALNRKALFGPQLLGDASGSESVLGLTREAFCEMLMTNRIPGDGRTMQQI